MKKIIFTLLVFTLTSGMYAGSRDAKSGIISETAVECAKDSQFLIGKVVDDKTSETLAGVTVLYNGRKYYADVDGEFRIEKSTDETGKILVSLISYEDQYVPVDFKSKSELQIKLKQL
jgi:hypothetical protein